jgi:Ca-activated chloride channel family protein
MHVSAHLDIDMLAVGRDEEVTCLLELTAPTPPELAARAPQGVVVVLDRSGSMGGTPIEAAHRAILTLVRRLGPDDRFGLVAFDDTAEVVVPFGQLGDMDSAWVADAIASVEAGGSTDLSAGYLMGLREAMRGPADAGTTVIVVSDGHANAGITDAQVLAAVAEQAKRTGATTTATLGLGDGYDEQLLATMARAGTGEHRYAPDVDAAVAEFAGLVDDLLAKSVTGALLRILPQEGLVGRIRVHGQLPSRAEGDGVVVDLGDLYAAEERRVLVGLHVPGLPRLGTATVADLELSYTTLPDLAVHTVTLPVSVNVVPGDAARGRVPDPRVRVERLLTGIDDVKRDVAKQLRSGDRASATSTLAGAIASTRAVRDGLDASTPDVAALRARIDEVLEDLADLERTASTASIEHSTKLVTESWAQTSSGRRRRTARPRPTPSVDPAATTVVEPPVDPDATTQVDR